MIILTWIRMSCHIHSNNYSCYFLLRKEHKYPSRIRLIIPFIRIFSEKVDTYIFPYCCYCYVKNPHQNASQGNHLHHLLPLNVRKCVLWEWESFPKSLVCKKEMSIFMTKQHLRFFPITVMIYTLPSLFFEHYQHYLQKPSGDWHLLCVKI